MLPPVQRIPNFMKFKENLLHGCCNISIFLPRLQISNIFQQKMSGIDLPLI